MARLLAGHVAGADQRLRLGVVDGDLREALAVEAVDAAVADVGGGGLAVVAEPQERQRRSHAVERGIAPRGVMDRGVGGAYGTGEPSRRVVGEAFGPRAQRVERRVARRGAGDVAAAMSAHAVGDEVTAERPVEGVGVLVALAQKADVGRTKGDPAGHGLTSRAPRRRRPG